MRNHKLIGGRWIVRSLFSKYGLWRGRVRDTWNGRMHEVATRQADRRKAEQVVIDWIEDMNRREEVEPMQFAAAFEEWLSLKDIKPSTLAGYQYAFDAILMPAFGERLIHEVEPKDIDEFLQHLRVGRGNSKKTQRERLVLLRSFFSWCVRRRYAWMDPTADIQIRRVPKYEGRALTYKEAGSLLGACRMKTVHPISDGRRHRGSQSWSPPSHLFVAVLAALHTGLRRGNVLGLRWSQLDLGARKITIAAEETKAQSALVLPIHPELAEIFRGLLRSQERVDADAHVLGVEIKELSNSFESAVRKAGLGHVRFHDLRHTFSTWLAACPFCSYVALRQLLGHSPGASVTLKYAQHVPFDELRRIVDRLPPLLSPGSTAASSSAPPA